MDWISELPDELLLRILLLLPTKDVVATMVLSKRWKFLWTLVPKLVYDDSYQNPEYGWFSRFVDRSLILQEGPVIESLHFKLGQICGSGDIEVWIRAAHKCCVRELIIEIDTSHWCISPVALPRSLYTCCTMLVKLRLINTILVDDVSSSCSFPSLKNLSLVSMKYPDDEFVKRLLCNCPVLENLVIERKHDDNVTIFNIIVPSLKRLVLYNSRHTYEPGALGFVIDAPSLELLDVFDDTDAFFVIKSNMPNIVEAEVVISYAHPEEILAYLTSVKRLSLCVSTSKDAYPVGSIFCCLVHVKICTCEMEWLNLLMRLLRDSPNLRTLKFEKCRGVEAVANPSWIEPSSVPECLLSGLETVEWVNYKGTEEEKEMMAFILRSGSCLKKVTIHAESTSDREKLGMIKELSFSPRRSPTCQLSFD